MSDEIRCHLCQLPGQEWCADLVGCNFRARQRLGIPIHACLEHQARELEELALRLGLEAQALEGDASGYRARAAAIAAGERRTLSPEYAAHIGSAAWEAFADEQRLLAGYRCEWPTCQKLDPHPTVHHIHYERFGQERPEDVLVLCPICHRDLDAKGRQGLAPAAAVRVIGTRRVVTVEAGRWVPRRWPFGNHTTAAGEAAGKEYAT